MQTRALRRLTAAVSLVLLTLACSGTRSNRHASNRATEYPTLLPSVSSSAEPPRLRGTGRVTSTEEGALGSFKISIGKPRALVHLDDNKTDWLGVQVTVSSVRGRPAIEFAQFVLNSGTSDTYGDPSTGLSPDSDDESDTERAACTGMPGLSDALQQEGMKPGPSTNPANDLGALDMSLRPGLSPTTGCVVFEAESIVHAGEATTIVYYASSLYETSSDQPEAYGPWPIVIPARPVRVGSPVPPPPGVDYSVTSDGGILDVTYQNPSGGQSQDTAVKGSTWKKHIANDDGSLSSPILVAQAAADASRITCSISVDGVEVAHETSHGPFAYVTCTGN